MSTNHYSNTKLLALFLATMVAMSSVFGGVALAAHSPGDGTIAVGNVSTESGTADDISINITSQDGTVSRQFNVTENEGFNVTLPANHTYNVSADEAIHQRVTRNIELNDSEDKSVVNATLPYNPVYNAEINGELTTEGTEDSVYIQVNNSSGALVHDGTYNTGNYSIVLTGTDGPYNVTASANNHTDVTKSVTLTNASRSTANFALNITQDGWANGTVQLNNGSGQNISVEMTQAGTLIDSATNLSSGDTYNFSAQPGTYELNVSAPDYQNETQTIDIPEDSTITTDFTLNLQNPSISGNIFTERNDYTNLVNMTVKNSTGDIVNTSNFQANAQYEIVVDNPGTYEVIANSSDHDLANKTVTIDNVTDDAANVTFQLQASSRGNLAVTASTDDGNASDIYVFVQETADTKTVSDGGTANFDLPTGDYTVEVSATDYSTETLNATVTENTTTSTGVTLQSADGQVTGTVDSPNASSTQNFTVSVVNTTNSTTVQNGGSFTFNLDPGEYTVEATAPGFTTASETVNITSNSAESITLDPYEPKNISVTLNLENTSLAQNGTVNVSETGNSYTVNDSETKNITGLRQGNYTLTLDADGHISQTTEVNVDGDGAERNITLIEQSGSTGFLGITVTSEDSNASNINVTINETGQTFYTNENETIQVELPEDNYTIEANANGYNATSKEVSVTENSTNSVSLTLNSSLPEVNVSGVRIVTDNSYWVGQNFWRENLSNYSHVQWENQVTTITLNRPINSSTNVYGDSVQNITSQIGPNSDYILYGVDSSGNRTQIASVYLGVQTLNASFNPNTTSETAELSLNSNRGNGYEVVVSQDSGDTNVLNNTRLKEVFGQNASTSIRQMNGTDKVVMQVPSGGFTTQMNVSELERAEYNFNYNVIDTPSQADASVTLTVPEFEGEPDATISDNGRYWLGQRLEVSDNIQDAETISIYRGNATFVQELNADEFGVVQIRTNKIGVGDYYIRDSDGNRIINFSVMKQTISANFTDDNVTNGGSLSESGLTVDSNRVGYDLLIKANYSNSSTDSEVRVDSSTLATAMGLNTTTVDDEEYVLAENMSNPETRIINFNNLTAGEYEFMITPEDATGNATANITVEVPVAGQANFAKQFYTHNRGDVAEMDVTFGGDAENVTLRIGRFNEVGYTLVANLTKKSNVSETTLLLDTSAAGQDEPDKVLKSTNSNVEISIVSETELPGDRKLAQARYLMELKVDNQTTDLSTLNLFKAGVLSGNFYGTPPTVSSVGSEEVIMNRSVNMSEIDSKSYVTLAFNVTGLETQLNGSNRDAADFENGSAFAQASGISINLEKDDAGMNTPQHNVNMGEALAYHYVTPDERADALGLTNNSSEEVGNHTTLYFVFDASSFNTDGDGVYHAEMNVTEENAYVENNISVTTNFTFVESETKFDRHWSGDVLVLPESNQTFTGTSTLPPGTQLTHEIRSENVRFPYYASSDIVVTENKTFEASYDLSSFPVGLEFNTSVPSQMGNKSVEVVSEIQPAPPEDMSNVTVFTQVGDRPESATVQLGNTTIDTSGEPPRGKVYIEKGTYKLTGQLQLNETNVSIDQTVTIDDNTENIIAHFDESTGDVTYADPRDLPDDYTLTVTVSSDSGQSIDSIVSVNGESKVTTDGTATFELEEGTYVVESQAHQHENGQTEVNLSQNKTVDMTLQSINVETPEPPSNNSTTPTPTSETPGQPGFGVVIALLALLGAALLARRS